MGGVSEGETSLKRDQDKFFLRLEGSVSTRKQWWIYSSEERI